MINHNEALTAEIDVDVDQDVEELEPVIAPGVSMNHNEVLVWTAGTA